MPNDADVNHADPEDLHDLIPDEAFVAAAEELFLELDADEAAQEQG